MKLWIVLVIDLHLSSFSFFPFTLSLSLSPKLLSGRQARPWWWHGFHLLEGQRCQCRKLPCGGRSGQWVSLSVYIQGDFFLVLRGVFFNRIFNKKAEIISIILSYCFFISLWLHSRPLSLSLALTQLDLARKLEKIAAEKGVQLFLATDVIVADKFAPDANNKVRTCTYIDSECVMIGTDRTAVRIDGIFAHNLSLDDLTLSLSLSMSHWCVSPHSFTISQTLSLYPTTLS